MSVVSMQYFTMYRHRCGGAQQNLHSTDARFNLKFHAESQMRISMHMCIFLRVYDFKRACWPAVITVTAALSVSTSQAILGHVT